MQRPHASTWTARIVVLSVAALASTPVRGAASLDAFRCYRTAPTKGSAKFPKGLQVTLADRFGTGRFAVAKPGTLCNPADLAAEGITDAATHLQGFQLKPVKGEPKQLAQKNLLVTNRFHPATSALRVDTGKADRLLVPSTTSPAGPIGAPDPSTHGVDHFRCHRVKVGAGAPKFPKGLQATVVDQFGQPKVVDVTKPTRLCVAVDVNGAEPDAPAHPTDLLCYLAKPAKKQPKHVKVLGLFVANELRADRVGTTKEDELCVPSTTTGGSAVATQTPTGGTPTPTPTPTALPTGAFAFVMPHQAAPDPASADLDFATRVRALDMYVMVDRSGSMSQEIVSVKNNLATVVRNLSCPPNGTGDPATCIADLWAGAGSIGYSMGSPFTHHVDVQPNPSFAGLATTEPGGCCMEPLTFGVYAAATGNGSAASGCSLATVAARPTCDGSPAANAGHATFGYPCFRADALPVILLATDEQPLSPGDTLKCPLWDAVVKPLMTTRNVKLVGILGSGAAANTDVDLRKMATDTGAVDAANQNAPLVFDGSGANAAAAIENGIRTLVAGVPIDVRALVEDDPADAVDTVAAFVDRIETLELGTAACTSGLTEHDADGDGFPDEYLDLRAGTPVCWRLVVKPNATVPAMASEQSFHATVRVVGDGVTELDTHDVYFTVPAAP